jgi:hypothetical protein
MLPEDVLYECHEKFTRKQGAKNGVILLHIRTEPVPIFSLYSGGFKRFGGLCLRTYLSGR